MTARFNPMHNGKLAFEDGMDALRKAYVDDYDTPLAIYPYGFAKEDDQASQHFTRAIEKATKTVVEHSMMIRGKQKNPITYQAYLLMGQAQGAMGLDLSAHEAFAIVKRMSDDPDQVTRSELYRAELMAKMGNGHAAIAALDELERRGLHEDFTLQAASVRSHALMAEKDYEAVVDLLAVALKEKMPPKARARLAFIKGQLHEEMDEGSLAREAYDACIRAQPGSYDMLLEAQLRKSLNGNGSGVRVQSLYKELEKLLREPKNALYEDRIYFALAKLAESVEDEGRAQGYWGQCIAQGSKLRPVVHAKAFAARGDWRFDQANYPGAQSDLDSAYHLLPAKHPLRESLDRRRKGLNALVKVLNNLQSNDSLRELASMSESELQKYFTKYVASLRQRIAEEERQAQQFELQAEMQMQSELQSASGPAIGGSGKWLFYNGPTRAMSASRFRQSWGDRPNVDQWRLQSASANWVMQSGGSDGVAGNGTDTEGEDPAFDVGLYMKQTPRGDSTVQALSRLICEDYIKAAAIYRDQIDDSDAAMGMLNKAALCESQSPLAWYAMHRLHLKREEPVQAASSREHVLKTFPSSTYAKHLRGEIVDQIGLLDQTSKDFQQLWDLSQEGSWLACLDLLKQGEFLATERPSVDFIQALALGATQGKQTYVDALIAIEQAYPNSPQAALATTYRNALTGDWAPDNQNNTGIQYVDATKAPHQLMIIISSKGNINDVRNALASFHQKYFSGKPLGLRVLPIDDDNHMIMVDGLKNAADALGYRTKVMRAATVTQFTKDHSPRYWPITVQNFSQFYSQKDLQGYSQFVQRIYPLP
jgi:tetratricopeptide (TPR) repeat protein|tara:strand:+ start:7962 stop:10424 length:2463 start_codon:yes stop_codon:yes gene_type:complete